MVRLFTVISARTQHAGWARATFLAACLTVWTGFALRRWAATWWLATRVGRGRLGARRGRRSRLRGRQGVRDG
jgi:hypothetical protein